MASTERLLSFDPGAERCGWAALEREISEKGKNKPPSYLGLGYFGLERRVNGSSTKYQKYRLQLLDFWIEKTPELLDRYRPDIVVAEIVPVVGGGNFVVATQSQLAATAITAIQIIAKQHKIPVEQIGATTTKKRIGGKNKATKVAVRNGVFEIMPELVDFKKEWTKMFDVSDAVATGLAYWGYRGNA